MSRMTAAPDVRGPKRTRNSRIEASHTDARATDLPMQVPSVASRKKRSIEPEAGRGFSHRFHIEWCLLIPPCSQHRFDVIRVLAIVRSIALDCYRLPRHETADSRIAFVSSCSLPATMPDSTLSVAADETASPQSKHPFGGATFAELNSVFGEANSIIRARQAA